MRTRDEFVARFRNHVAGLALCGMASDVKDGPLARGARALEIPGEVQRLLESMYDYLAHDPPEPVGSNHHAGGNGANGTPHLTNGRKG